MTKYIIDRDAAGPFDDPAWLDDLWLLATKRFGVGTIDDTIDEMDANRIRLKGLEIEKNLKPFCDYLATLTHRTSDDWLNVILGAIFGEPNDD